MFALKSYPEFSTGRVVWYEGLLVEVCLSVFRKSVRNGDPVDVGDGV